MQTDSQMTQRKVRRARIIHLYDLINRNSLACRIDLWLLTQTDQLFCSLFRIILPCSIRIAATTVVTACCRQSQSQVYAFSAHFAIAEVWCFLAKSPTDNCDCLDSVSCTRLVNFGYSTRILQVVCCLKLLFLCF